MSTLPHHPRFRLICRTSTFLHLFGIIIIIIIIGTFHLWQLVVTFVVVIIIIIFVVVVVVNFIDIIITIIVIIIIIFFAGLLKNSNQPLNHFQLSVATCVAQALVRHVGCV